MNSRDTFLTSKSSVTISKTEIARSETKIQSTHSSLVDFLKPNRNKLTARWVMEDGQLVCRWTIDPILPHSQRRNNE